VCGQEWHECSFQILSSQGRKTHLWQKCASLFWHESKNPHTPTHAPPTLWAPCQFELRPGGCHRISRCLLMLYLFCVKSRADALSLSLSIVAVCFDFDSFPFPCVCKCVDCFLRICLKISHTHTVCHTQEHSFRAPGKRSHNFLPGDWLRKLVIFTICMQ
jgi:hypothetical protein